MKILRSRWFYIILANVLILAMLIMGIGLAFRHFTKGELYEADGFTQNSHVNFTRFSAGKLSFSYSIENHTSKTIKMINSFPEISVFQEGEWQAIDLGMTLGFNVNNEEVSDGISEIPAFSAQSRTIYAVRGKILDENGNPVDAPAGVYRLVYHAEDFDIVGYVTVTDPE